MRTSVVSVASVVSGSRLDHVDVLVEAVGGGGVGPWVDAAQGDPIDCFPASRTPKAIYILNTINTSTR